MKRIIVAGGTGYLGQHIIKTLSDRGYDVVVVVRSASKIKHLEPFIKELIVADITSPEDIKGIMKGGDALITSVGITRQKDGLSYMDVDYGCNKNLLNEAMACGVKKFMYIAALNGDQMTHLKIMNAKEKFVDLLQNSAIESYIIRPSGFFSDMTEMYTMAKKGKVYNAGNGQYKANPIHGSDLAEFCIDKLNGDTGVYSVGGPDILSQKDITTMAFDILHVKAKIVKVPLWVIRTSKWLLVHFTKQSFYGPIEFFLTVLTQDMLAPKYGRVKLIDYFKTIDGGSEAVK